MCHYSIEAALTAILDSTTEVEPAAPSGASSNSPAGVVTSQRESGENGLQHNQATTEDMAFDKTEEGENKRDVKTEAPSVDIGRPYFFCVAAVRSRTGSVV